MAFNERLSYIEKYVNQDLISTLDLDLGNYTEIYVDTLTKVKNSKKIKFREILVKCFFQI